MRSALAIEGTLVPAKAATWLHPQTCAAHVAHPTGRMCMRQSMPTRKAVVPRLAPCCASAQGTTDHICMQILVHKSAWPLPWSPHGRFIPRLMLCATPRHQGNESALRRPAEAPRWWPQGIFAPVDTQAGGTWIAVGRDGRMGFLTNFREPLVRL